MQRLEVIIKRGGRKQGGAGMGGVRLTPSNTSSRRDI
jgi:hypothetical protein